MGVYETLAKVQADIAVPKSRTNKFGGYSYRNAEDIMEAVKPACLKHGAAFFVSDAVEFIEGRFYIVATATFSADGETVQAKGYARECDAKKGMDEAQITGSASSYARKYALCGLFGIDGQDDPDAMDNRDEKQQKKKQEPKPKQRNHATKDQLEAINGICADLDGVKDKGSAEWLAAALKSKAAEAAGIKEGVELYEDQAGVVIEVLRRWAESVGLNY